MQINFKKYLNYGLKNGADEIEVFYQESQENSVEVRKQKVEKLQAALDKGLAIRLIKNKKLGFSYTTSLQETDILKTIENALDSAEYTDSDEYQQMPLPKPAPQKKLKIFDPAIAKLTPKARINVAKNLEKSAYAYNKKIKKTESASFSSGMVKTWLYNSHGVNLAEERTYCGVSLEIIAADKKQMEAGYDYQYTTSFKKLNPELVALNAAEKAVKMLSAVDIATGTYDLLLTPKVSINFLSVILPMFCADNIQKNKSLLKGKLQQNIAAKIVNIVDDPLLPYGLGSYHLDAEGVPGKTKDLVKNGRLKQLLYDTYTANKDQTSSTGNSIRYSLKAEPDIGGSNFYIVPGRQSEKHLIKNIAKGLLIHNVMGLHTADPISGQFSLGAVGQLIDKGKITKAVKNIAIAGNLSEFLQNISALGNNLEFLPESGSIGSPSLVIKNIKVAGNI